MGYAARIADETAAHLDALRDRRVPRLLAWWMTLRLHRELTNSVIQDHRFGEHVIEPLLAPATKDEVMA